MNFSCINFNTHAFRNVYLSFFLYFLQLMGFGVAESIPNRLKHHLCVISSHILQKPRKESRQFCPWLMLQEKVKRKQNRRSSAAAMHEISNNQRKEFSYSSGNGWQNFILKTKTFRQQWPSSGLLDWHTSQSLLHPAEEKNSLRFLSKVLIYIFFVAKIPFLYVIQYFMWKSWAAAAIAAHVHTLLYLTA